MSLVLLVGSGLMLRSFVALRNVEPGGTFSDDGRPHLRRSRIAREPAPRRFTRGHVQPRSKWVSAGYFEALGIPILAPGCDPGVSLAPSLACTSGSSEPRRYRWLRAEGCIFARCTPRRHPLYAGAAVRLDEVRPR
jgi:hypothetical protein